MNIIKRKAVMRDIPLDKMAVSDLAQRRLSEDWVSALLNDFDIDEMGYPVVSERGGQFYILDGQHRIEALKRWLGEWHGQKVACVTYTGLTEALEAAKFVQLNNRRTIMTFDKFKAQVTAGHDPEARIYRMVQKEGLVISRSRSNGSGGITAVSALLKVYTRSGPEELRRALRIIRDSFGDAGFESAVIEGIGALCKRYNGALEDDKAILKLGSMRGGVKGLVNRGAELRLRTGNTLPHCVAAAAVDVINAGRGGAGKLASWWKADVG